MCIVSIYLHLIIISIPFCNKAIALPKYELYRNIFIPLFTT